MAPGNDPVDVGTLDPIDNNPQEPDLAELTINIRVPVGSADQSSDRHEITTRDNIADPSDAPQFPMGSPTRATTPTEENNIVEIHVLGFSAGELKEIRRGSAITNVDERNRTFKLWFPTETYDLMILANSLTEISGLSTGMTLAQVRTALQRSQTAKRPDDQPIPMWGEVKNVAINSGIDLGTVNLYRALAKIDIAVDPAAQSDFTLQTVAMFHWQEKVALIPAASPTEAFFTQATTTGSGLTLKANPIRFAAADLTTAGIALESSLYVNETDHPGVSAFPELPCLVVGGLVDGETRYYRIDFTQPTSGGTSYIDLIRNWRYELVIKGIITNGSPTEDEAYLSTEVGLTAEIRPWEESGMDDVIIDGTDWLRVELGGFTLPREQRTATWATYEPDDNQFVIESNLDWTIDRNAIVYSPANQTGWLTLNDYAGIADTKYDMRIYVAGNTGTVERTATFTVAAENIRKAVTVTQTTDPMVSVSVNLPINYASFAHMVLANYGDEYVVEFDVEWYPAEWECRVSITDAGVDDLDIESGLSDGEVLTGGKKHIRMVMKPETKPLPTVSNVSTGYRGAVLNFTVGEGNTARSGSIYIFTRYLFMTQMQEFKSPYRIDIGNIHSIDLLTNMAFRVKSVTDEYGILTAASKAAWEQVESGWNGTPLLESSFSMRNFEFVAPNPALDGKKAYLEIEYAVHPENNSLSKTFTIEAEYYYMFPNSYLLARGGDVRIPVRKAYRAWSVPPLNETLNENGALKAELLWYDTPTPVVQEVTLTPTGGAGKDSEIYVKTRNDVGNAVVGLFVDGTLRWSWHIWVADYNPDAGGQTYTYGANTFMDRNLGATVKTASAANLHTAVGYMYQWGRKDPLPPHNGDAGGALVQFPATARTTYGNYKFDTQTKSATTARDTYAASIQNPTTFYISPNAPNDWSDISFQQRWRTGPSPYFKTEHDPCPHGWMVAMKDAAAAGSGPWGVFPNGTFALGITLPNGDHFPASGTIFSTDARYTTNGTRPAMWTANPDGNRGATGLYSASAGSTQVQYTYHVGATGAPVRCQRIR